jgi:hypothetical protein
MVLEGRRKRERTCMALLALEDGKEKDDRDDDDCQPVSSAVAFL